MLKMLKVFDNSFRRTDIKTYFRTNKNFDKNFVILALSGECNLFKNIFIGYFGPKICEIWVSKRVQNNQFITIISYKYHYGPISQKNAPRIFSTFYSIFFRCQQKKFSYCSCRKLTLKSTSVFIIISAYVLMMKIKE
jgi:hypothetical protein